MFFTVGKSVRLLLLVLVGSLVSAQTSEQVYKFTETSFATFMWIKGGDLFTNPKLVEVEMTNAGTFALEVYDSSDHLISKGERENLHGGWSTFDFHSGMTPLVFAGKYKLKLVNRSSGVRQVKQGQVTLAM